MGWFGIKPFASNSVFKGDSSPDSPHAEEDNRIARLTLRYILCNPAITAPMPGLISQTQVDNVALAVKERRELDVRRRRNSSGSWTAPSPTCRQLPVAEGLGVRVSPLPAREAWSDG